MRNWRTISAGLVLTMLVLGIVMVLRITSLTEQTSQFEDQLTSLTADTIHSVVSEVREISTKDPNPYYGVLLFMLLLQEAWYYPDEAVDPLSEAFGSGKRIYWDYERAREMVGPELAFGYLYAGLPAQLDEWQAQVVAQEPHKRYRLRFLQAAGKLLSDDLLAARQIVDSELEVGADTTRGKAFALLCNMMLEDYEAARALDLDGEMVEAFDLNQQLAFAELLLMDGEFNAAVDHYTALIEQTDFSPERHLEIAVPMAALSGINHPQVQVELALAAKSTRIHLSLAGAQAAVLSELLRFGAAGNWNSQLEQLAVEHPRDFWVQAALLESRLQTQKHALANPHSDYQKNQMPGFSAASTTLLALANTMHEQQWANLLLAAEAAYGYYADPIANADGLDTSLRFFKQALGDPQVEGAIVSTRIPDYDFLVLDPVINELRSTNIDYNADVNHALVDYLRRVQERYAGVVEQKELKYRIP